MLFPENIASVRLEDRVSEIGPGLSPHPRPDAFLELDFDAPQDRNSQRGGMLDRADFGDRPVRHYKQWAFLDRFESDRLFAAEAIVDLETQPASRSPIVPKGALGRVFGRIANKVGL